MPVNATALLLFSAALHALWNAFVKKSDDAQTTLFGILAVASVTAVACAFWIAPPAFGQSLAIPWSVAAGFFEAAYMIFLARALRDSSLGISYVIMRGGAMLIVWAISAFFLGEPFTHQVFIGLVTMLTGLFITSSSSKSISPNAMLWPVLCALFIAGYHLCYGQAMGAQAKAPAVFAVAMAVALPLFGVTTGLTGVQKLKQRFGQKPLPMVLGGLICGASFMLFLVGLTHSGAGYAITLRNTSILFAQIFALAIGEKISGRQWAGATLVMIGASCLAI